MQLGKYEPLEVPNINGYLTTFLLILNQFDSLILIVLALWLNKSNTYAKSDLIKKLVVTCHIADINMGSNSISSVAFGIMAIFELFHCILILIYFLFRIVGLEAPQNNKINPKYHCSLVLSAFIGLLGSIYILVDGKFTLKPSLAAIGLILLGLCRLLRYPSFCSQITILEVNDTDYQENEDQHKGEGEGEKSSMLLNSQSDSVDAVEVLGVVETLQLEQLEEGSNNDSNNVDNNNGNNDNANSTVDTNTAVNVNITNKSDPQPETEPQHESESQSQPICSIKICGVDICQATLNKIPNLNLNLNTIITKMNKIQLPIPKSGNLLEKTHYFHFIRLGYILVLLGVLGLEYSSHYYHHNRNGDDKCWHLQKRVHGLALTIPIVLCMLSIEILYMLNMCYISIYLLKKSKHSKYMNKNRNILYISSCVYGSGIASCIGVLMILSDLHMRTIGIVGLVCLGISQFICTYMFCMNNINHIHWNLMELFHNTGGVAGGGRSFCPILPIFNNINTNNNSDNSDNSEMEMLNSNSVTNSNNSTEDNPHTV